MTGALLKLEIAQGVELSGSALAGKIHHVGKASEGNRTDAGSPVDGTGLQVITLSVGT